MSHPPRAALLFATALYALSTPGSAQEGATSYKQRCALCHATAPGAPPRLGPNLAGSFGRGAGKGAFAYSAALKSSRLIWNDATLDAWLANPVKLVPGTRMMTTVADPQERKRIIAYLKTLKD